VQTCQYETLNHTNIFVPDFSNFTYQGVAKIDDRNLDHWRGYDKDGYRTDYYDTEVENDPVIVEFRSEGGKFCLTLCS
jgi:hypothetical protein